jgi:hypothetical protein
MKPTAIAAPPTQTGPPDPSLEDLLRTGQWQQADQVTLALMLTACDRTPQGWLDFNSLVHLPCETLHQIDHLWETYSGGQFGFSVQHQIYQQTGTESLAFSVAVDWVRSHRRPLAFCKFYHQLNFTMTAPKGHLPALWYWQISYWESLRTGGFGTGRGAGYGDAARLDALMLRLQRCQAI